MVTPLPYSQCLRVTFLLSRCPCGPILTCILRISFPFSSDLMISLLQPLPELAPCRIPPPFTLSPSDPFLSPRVPLTLFLLRYDDTPASTFIFPLPFPPSPISLPLPACPSLPLRPGDPPCFLTTAGGQSRFFYAWSILNGLSYTAQNINKHIQMRLH